MNWPHTVVGCKGKEKYLRENFHFWRVYMFLEILDPSFKSHVHTVITLRGNLTVEWEKNHPYTRWFLAYSQEPLSNQVERWI